MLTGGFSISSRLLSWFKEPSPRRRFWSTTKTDLKSPLLFMGMWNDINLRFGLSSATPAQQLKTRFLRIITDNGFTVFYSEIKPHFPISSSLIQAASGLETVVSYASYVLAQALTLSQCKNIQQFRLTCIMQLSCAMNMTSGICQ